MTAKSKSQQRLFGMVHQCQKTGKCASPAVSKTAKSISFDDAGEFASTKHKGLPEKKENVFVCKYRIIRQHDTPRTMSDEEVQMHFERVFGEGKRMI